VKNVCRKYSGTKVEYKLKKQPCRVQGLLFVKVYIGGLAIFSYSLKIFFDKKEGMYMLAPALNTEVVGVTGGVGNGMPDILM